MGEARDPLQKNTALQRAQPMLLWKNTALQRAQPMLLWKNTALQHAQPMLPWKTIFSPSPPTVCSQQHGFRALEGGVLA